MGGDSPTYGAEKKKNSYHENIFATRKTLLKTSREDNKKKRSRVVNRIPSY